MAVDDYLVDGFDQSAKWGVQVNNAHAGGLCVGLCAKWLRLRVKYAGSGTAGAQARMLKLGAGSVGNKALARMNGHHRAIDTNRAILRDYQLDREGFNSFRVLTAAIATTVRSTSRGMYFMTITCPRYGNLNHALAVYLSKGGNVHFFDPNEGEYQMKKAQFASFLSQFLAGKYGVANDMVTEFFKVGSTA